MVKRQTHRYHQNYSNRSFLSRRRERKSKKNFLLTLIICAVLLYILIAWFIPTFIASLSFFNRFKGTSEPVKQVTEGAVLAPPVLNIPYETTSSATIYVRGYTMPNTSVEIYLNDELSSTAKSDIEGIFISDSVNLDLGKNSIYGKTVDAAGNKSYSSKPIIISYSNEKPTLEVTSPEDNLVIKGGDKKVTFSGKTNQDKEILVAINGNRAIVNSDGAFSQSLQINEGDNEISITATDKAGNTTQLKRKVTYQP